MSRREKPPKTNQIVLLGAGPEVMEWRLLLTLLPGVRYGHRLCWCAAPGQPRESGVIHWEVIAEQGHVISSVKYPLAVSSAQKSCPTSFTHLSRQNNKGGDGNSGPCTRIVSLLKEKERSRLDSEWDKEHVWTDSCHPMGCVARQASLSLGFSRQDY